MFEVEAKRRSPKPDLLVVAGSEAQRAKSQTCERLLEIYPIYTTPYTPFWGWCFVEIGIIVFQTINFYVLKSDASRQEGWAIINMKNDWSKI
jgi:hypothetical protein